MKNPNFETATATETAEFIMHEAPSITFSDFRTEMLRLCPEVVEDDLMLTIYKMHQTINSEREFMKTWTPPDWENDPEVDPVRHQGRRERDWHAYLPPERPNLVTNEAERPKTPLDKVFALVRRFL